MHPYLFELGISGHPVRVPTYGVLLAAAFSTAYFLSLWRARRIGEDFQHIENIFLLVVVSSILGSRLFHVLFEELDFYRANPSKVFAIWEGGYTFYGALLAAVSVIYGYCRWRGLSFLSYGDITAPSTALALVIGRFGCFCAGCCWGKATNCWLGVAFTHPDSFAASKGVPLHPTQLYEAVGALLIFCYLTWRFRRRRYPGQILFQGLLCYAILRFVVEIFRGDDYRGYLFHGMLSTSQFISLGVLAVASAAIVNQRK